MPAALGIAAVVATFLLVRAMTSEPEGAGRVPADAAQTPAAGTGQDDRDDRRRGARADDGDAIVQAANGGDGQAEEPQVPGEVHLSRFAPDAVVDDLFADVPGDQDGQPPPADPWLAEVELAAVPAADPLDAPDPPLADAEAQAPARLPVPAADEQQQALAAVRQIFREEYAGLRSASDRTAFGSELLAQGLETHGNPAARYVLFRQALALAVEAADPALAQKAVDALARSYEVNAFQAKIAAFREISRLARTASERQMLVESALAVADAAVEAEQFDAGWELVSLAYSVSTRVRDADLRAEAGERRDAIREARQRWADAQAARETLAALPDDPAANETLGSYLCFVAGDWPQGLPHLAKAAHPALRALAERETAAGEHPDAETAAAIGDAWFEHAQASSRSERPDFRVRAADWYRRALDGLSGLDRTRVEKQIQELDRQALRDAKSAGRRVAGAKAAEGLIGRCLVDNIDAGLILGYQTGHYLRDATVRTLLGRHGIAGGSVRIELHGVLAVPRDMELVITHIGGSSNKGIARLYVNNRELGSVGDYRTKSTVYTLALPRGLYAVRWLLTGGDLGPCWLQFKDSASGEAVPVFYTKTMLDGLRRLPTNTEASVSTE